MSTGGATGNGDAVRINAVFLGVGADEANGCFHVVQLVRHGRFVVEAVVYRNEGNAVVHNAFEHVVRGAIILIHGLNQLVRRFLAGGGLHVGRRWDFVAFIGANDPTAAMDKE